jgi:asparagine synthetase B (glutamine-hydrolysing)
MSDTDYARQTADLFFRTHDPTMEMRRLRNFIPEHVLKTFCGPNMWVFGDETQMYAREKLGILIFLYCRGPHTCRVGQFTDDDRWLLPGTSPLIPNS